MLLLCVLLLVYWAGLLSASLCRFVFVSQKPYEPVFGSRETADALCAAEARNGTAAVIAVSDTHDFRAWLGFDNSDVLEHLSLTSDACFVNTQLEPIANSTDEFLGDIHHAPVVFGADGLQGRRRFWSGLFADGTVDENSNCQSWTTAARTSRALSGNARDVLDASTNGGIITWSNETRPRCSVVSRGLLCVAVPRTSFETSTSTLTTNTNVEISTVEVETSQTTSTTLPSSTTSASSSTTKQIGIEAQSFLSSSSSSSLSSTQSPSALSSTSSTSSSSTPTLSTTTTTTTSSSASVTVSDKNMDGFSSTVVIVLCVVAFVLLVIAVGAVIFAARVRTRRRLDEAPGTYDYDGDELDSYLTPTVSYIFDE
eukprot:TRINITY_DN379_c0_g6_i1.p1 TRINITY_DN379_c0_g6~~TRINITY_DN379_c0_g6_i1.p1  ORF type:complete len:382 (-),score=80.86 TRINITY_DN379_c0_g6_i1:15-1124(-)